MTILGRPLTGRAVALDPHMAGLTENSRIFAAAAPLGEMEPWQIVNFLRAIEDDAARRALLAAAAALRAALPNDDVLALLESWARRPDRLVR